MQIEILPIGTDGEMQVIANGLPCAILRYTADKHAGRIIPGTYSSGIDDLEAYLEHIDINETGAAA